MAGLRASNKWLWSSLSKVPAPLCGGEPKSSRNAWLLRPRESGGANVIAFALDFGKGLESLDRRVRVRGLAPSMLPRGNMKPAILAVLTFGFFLCDSTICQDEAPAAKAESEWKLAAVTLKFRGVLKGLVKDVPGQPLYLDHGTGPGRFSRSLVVKVEDLPEEDVKAVMERLSIRAESKAIVEALYAARMRAAGKVPVNGKWYTPEEAKAEEARLAAKREEAEAAYVTAGRLAAEARQREEDARLVEAAKRAAEAERREAVARAWQGREETLTDDRGNTMTRGQIEDQLAAIRRGIEAEPNPYKKAFLEGMERATLQHWEKIKRERGW